MTKGIGRSLALLALLACGCAPTIRVETAAPPGPAPLRQAELPVAIDTARVTIDDAPMNVSDELLLLAATNLRKSALFTDVYEPAVSHEAPEDALRLDLVVAQQDHPENPVVGTLKVMFVLASVHLLAPVLPLRYGYEVEVVATFERSDGWTRSYRSHAAGSASFPMTFSDPRRAGIETRSAVLGRALELLTYELAKDPELGRRPGDG